MMHKKIGALHLYCLKCMLTFRLALFVPENTPESSVFQWKRFLDIAFNLHIWLIDWDGDIFPIGPGFELRTMTPAQLKALTKARIEKEVDGETDEVEFKFVRWPQGWCDVLF